MAYVPAPTRFLANLSTLALVLGLAFAAFTLLGAAVGLAPFDTVAVRTRVDADRFTPLPPGVLAPDHALLTVRVPDATREQLRWAAARDAAPVVVVLAAIWLLRGLLRSVGDGEAFTAANIVRLRSLALVVLIGVPLAGFVASIFAGELAASTGVDGPGTQLALSANALLGGLAILVLAEVFAAGVRLRSDLEGTV
jgi:hypothetical protein